MNPDRSSQARSKRDGSPSLAAASRASSSFSWSSLVVTLLVLSSFPNPLRAQGSSAQPGAPAARPMPAVFNVQRSRSADILTLETGEKLSGRLLNPSLTLRTAYGTLLLETRALAGIDLPEGPSGLASVLTVNSNRLTGLIEDPQLRFEPRNGAPGEVRREKVLRIVFGLREGEAGQPAPELWVRLKNGDLLTGQLQIESLVLNTTNGQKTVSPKDLRSLRLPAKETAAAVLSLRNGELLSGTLTTEDLAVRLDLGPKVDLYLGSIDWISDHSEGDSRVALGASTADGPARLEGMIWIAPGQFVMGSPTDEVGRDRDEGPQTTVVIPQGFWMSRCEVTQAEYQRLTGSNPSNNTEDPQLPVEKVSWFEATDFCAKLTQQAEAAGRLPKGCVYRLPTEAEWEYACRAGTTTRFSYGDDKTESQLRDYAWFARNSESTAHPVGTRRPNAWGLCDMHGNVWEWCLDRWAGALPGGTITNNPVAAEGTLRVARGGSWLYEAKACRSANRDDYSPSNRCGDVGFRVVLVPVPP